MGLEPKTENENDFPVSVLIKRFPSCENMFVIKVFEWLNSDDNYNEMSNS